jgi:REP element-mobilizing transposase RayT
MNQLAAPKVAAALFETIEHRNQRHLWFAYMVLLMPDHLHGLFSFPPHCKSIKRVIWKWKEWTAIRLGIRWQRDFFEHRLRDKESWKEKSIYIAQNPVRAGLVAEAEAWPFIWRSSLPAPPMR